MVLRCPRMLWASLGRAAERNQRSLNTEIIDRLRSTFEERGTPILIAQEILESLPRAVLHELGQVLFKKLVEEGKISFVD